MATQVGAQKRGNLVAKLTGHQTVVTEERGSWAKLLRVGCQDLHLVQRSMALEVAGILADGDRACYDLPGSLKARLCRHRGCLLLCDEMVSRGA